MKFSNRFSLSLSSKIALLFTLLIFIIVLFFSAVTISLIRTSLLSQKEREVTDALDKINRQFETADLNSEETAGQLVREAELPFYILYTIYDSEKNIWTTNDPFIPLLSPVPRGTVQRYKKNDFFTDGDLDILYTGGRVNTSSKNGARLYAQTSLDMGLDTTDSFLNRLPVVFLLCTLPLLLVSWTAAKFTSARVLKPIRVIISTAKEIEADKLDRRLTIPPADDELKELASAFNSMFGRLEEDFVRQKRFTSDVSHELKTPLSVILGYADILYRWGKSDQAVLDKAVEAIYTESISMKKLIEDLQILSCTDKEQDMPLYAKETVFVRDLLDNVKKDTTLIAPDTIISINCPGDITITANTNALRQVLRIIINNSIAYSTFRAYISLSAKKVSGQTGQKTDSVVLTVNDQGCGIPAPALPYIFDRFFRTDESRNRRSGGSGLGLSIAKNIIERLGGTITAESEPDKGTSIIITF